MGPRFHFYTWFLFAETQAPCELSYISFRCWASRLELMCPVRVKVQFCTGQAITKQSLSSVLLEPEGCGRSHGEWGFWAAQDSVPEWIRGWELLNSSTMWGLAQISWLTSFHKLKSHLALHYKVPLLHQTNTRDEKHSSICFLHNLNF